MWSRSSILGVIALALIAGGCSKSSDNGSAQAPPASNLNSTSTAANGAQQDPKLVVTAFLDAIRAGSDDKAMSLLTKAAHQKAVETNRSPTPPASDTAHFEVGETEFLGEDGARVACKWTDLDESGQPRTDKALWVCRRESEGWRVAGVAAIVFENEEPLLLNFEDPADMAKKQQWLRGEIVRRTKPEPGSPAEKADAFQAEKKPQDAFRR